MFYYACELAEVQPILHSSVTKNLHSIGSVYTKGRGFAWEVLCPDYFKYIMWSGDETRGKACVYVYKTSRTLKTKKDVQARWG